MMHWFWRAAIAVVAAVVLSVALVALVQYVGLLAYIQKLGPKGSHGFIQFIAFMSIPSVMSLAVFGGLTQLLARLRRAKGNRRRKKGLCLKCGYNLKGNVSGVCPECGEQI